MMVKMPQVSTHPPASQDFRVVGFDPNIFVWKDQTNLKRPTIIINPSEENIHFLLAYVILFSMVFWKFRNLTPTFWENQPQYVSICFIFNLRYSYQRLKKIFSINGKG